MADTMEHHAETAAPELPRGTDLCVARIIAGKVAEHAAVAYWVESRNGGDFDYHQKEMSKHFRELADLFGYRLVAK